MRSFQNSLHLWSRSTFTLFIVLIIIMILLPTVLFKIYLNHTDHSLQIGEYGRLIVDEVRGSVDFRQLNFQGYVCVALPEIEDTNGTYIYNFDSTENIPSLSKVVRSHMRSIVSRFVDDIGRNNFFFLLVDQHGNYREYSRTLAATQNGKTLNQHLMFRNEAIVHPNPTKCSPLEQAFATCESWQGNTHFARQCFFAFGQMK
ncbi:MAG: hypothetical protein ING16_14080 [Roseomonas sp.]|nr:hypothetical protein [Roseomonas sp.]